MEVTFGEESLLTISSWNARSERQFLRSLRTLLDKRLLTLESEIDALQPSSSKKTTENQSSASDYRTSWIFAQAFPSSIKPAESETVSDKSAETSKKQKKSSDRDKGGTGPRYRQYENRCRLVDCGDRLSHGPHYTEDGYCTGHAYDRT